jgi:hypothetical protein
MVSTNVVFEDVRVRLIVSQSAADVSKGLDLIHICLEYRIHMSRSH